MSSVFTFIPRPIYEFAGLDMASRYAFGLIYDRLQLSAKNRDRFTDHYGLYCVFSRESMAAEMGITVPTLRKAIKQLIDRELITSRMAEAGGCWRYYLLQRARDSIEMQELPDIPYIRSATNRIVEPL
jgi:hypothetical protein